MSTEPEVPIPELVGRTITEAKIGEQRDHWGDCGGDLYLTLDDGTTVHVSAWGHDAWGTDVRIGPPVS